MAEEEVSTEEEEVVEEDKEEAEEEVEEVVEEKVKKKTKVKEEKTTNITLNVDNKEISEMKSQISELKELLMEKKKMKEAIVDETKGEVVKEIEEDIKNVDNIIVEKARRGFAIYRDYANEGSESTLKRLIR